MDRQARVVAVYNPSAGAVGPDGENRLRQALEELNLTDAAISAFDRADPGGQFASIISQEPDLIIVWGGDGTHRRALIELGPDRHVLLLPGGTANLLCRWLHGDMPWRDTLRTVLAAPLPRSVPAGLAGDAPFFCAMVTGAPAYLADMRESLRRWDLRQAFSRLTGALARGRDLHVRLHGDHQRIEADGLLRRANVIGARVGPLSRSGGMEAVFLSLPSALATLTHTWEAFRSGWRRMSGAQVLAVSSMELRSETVGGVLAVLDGEVLALPAAFDIIYRPHAASCLVALSGHGSG